MMAPKITPKQKYDSVTMLQRFAKIDRMTDSFNIYGDLIRSIANNQTDSPEGAEKVVREIFLDLWQYTENAASTDFDENIYISIIAQRHLIRRTSKN